MSESATPFTPEQLPARLGLKEFSNDRYRSVLYFAPDIGFRQDDSSPAFQVLPFQEFHWGRSLRTRAGEDDEVSVGRPGATLPLNRRHS